MTRHEEIELYARGLVLADGTVNGSATKFDLGKKGEGVLQKIGKEMNSVNGVRFNRNSYQLTVPGKAWWKHSTEGLDTVHAFRGYIDGDGCWSRNISWKYRPNPSRGKWVYLLLVLLVAEKDYGLVLPWVRDCLEGFRFSCREIVVEAGSKTLQKVFVLNGFEAERLYWKLYRESRISMHQRGEVYRKLYVGLPQGVRIEQRRWYNEQGVLVI